MKRSLLLLTAGLLAIACKKKPQQIPVPAPAPVAAVPAPQPEAKPQPAPVPVKKPQPVVPTPAPAPLPTTAPPQLGEMLSPERRRQLETGFDQSIGRAKAALDQAAKATLTADQRNTAARIRTFVAQAIEARSKDLPTAAQLARRADLLSADLVKSLR